MILNLFLRFNVVYAVRCELVSVKRSMMSMVVDRCRWSVLRLASSTATVVVVSLSPSRSTLPSNAELLLYATSHIHVRY